MYHKIDKTIYFTHQYNKKISNDILLILKECDTICFDNNDYYNICYKTNNLYDVTDINYYKRSIFNKPINNLPNSITHLILGWNFNQPINNLPITITHLILSLNYNNKIDYFSNSLIINKI